LETPGAKPVDSFFSAFRDVIMALDLVGVWLLWEMCLVEMKEGAGKPVVHGQEKNDIASAIMSLPAANR
jgi:chorismate synthase